MAEVGGGHAGYYSDSSTRSAERGQVAPGVVPADSLESEDPRGVL